MSLRVIALLTITALALSGAVGAVDRQLPGRVLWVVDGDSLVLDVRGSQYRIELSGIDAPELNQPWGQAAADRLKRALTGRFVVVESADFAPEGQVHGRLSYANRDIGLDLLHEGLAWCTIGPVTEIPYDTNHPYRDAESAARQARRGLWSDEHAVPPWEWRRQGPQNLN
jgi:endonuclease YncB( thermonuclease family)